MNTDKHGKLEFFASCAGGLERIVADELSSMGISGVRPLSSGVSLRATIEQACRAMLWLRCASRVLLVLERVDASSSDALYSSCADIEWEEHIPSLATIAVHAKGTSKALTNSRFTALKVKDAICDRLRRVRGARPDVDPESPDIPVRVSIHGEKATISLDLCGAPLHRRGYRVATGDVAAPMKETLAAAVLITGGWPKIARSGGMLVDPFCGSGTIAIEGAMMACDIAPGIARADWTISNMRWFDSSVMDDLLTEADERMEAGLALVTSGAAAPRVLASDIDPAAVATARASARRAGVGEVMEILCSDVTRLDLPDAGAVSLVATNPPYGERVLDISRLMPVLSALRGRVGASEGNWDVAMILPGAVSDAVFSASPEREVSTYNGPIEVSIRSYRSADVQTTGKLASAAEQFANRLAKMARHRGKWAKRTGVTCYRVYDADLPDFNLSVDLYQGAGSDEGRRWVQVCEYAPPRSVDPALAASRAALAVEEVRKAFDVDASDVFLKRRMRSKGGSQYSDGGVGGGSRSRGGGSATTGKPAPSRSPGASRRSASARPAPDIMPAGHHIVAEGPNLFEVAFDSGLDTGLFLDSREIRKMIGSISAGKSFLNLFAYTGAASVWAASGGARSTLTVDMSRTYLDWAGRNMKLNGFTGPNHTFERADAVRWVSDTRHSSKRFDLVYVDPPTFSNSKKMSSRTWDVQRDHVELLIGVSRILEREGQAIFCCNLRGFEPDVEKLEHAGVGIVEVSGRTIPEDFSRNSRIHHCYIVRRLLAS